MRKKLNLLFVAGILFTLCSCDALLNHVHDESGEWFTGTDTSKHIKICPGCNEVIATENHSFGETTEITAPTCENNGVGKRICSVCGYEDDNVVIPKLGHDYKAPVYTWTVKSGEYYCTAKATCNNDSFHKVSEEVKASKEIIIVGDCSTGEKAKYTATFSNSMFQTQTKEVTGNISGHNYGTVSYNWEFKDNNYYCTASRTCLSDSTHVENEKVTANVYDLENNTFEKAGKLTLKAEFTTNTNFIAQTKEYTLPILTADKLSKVEANEEYEEYYTYTFNGLDTRYFSKNNNDYTETTLSYFKKNETGHTHNFDYQAFKLIKSVDDLKDGMKIILVGGSSDEQYYFASGLTGDSVANISNETLNINLNSSYQYITLEKFEKNGGLFALKFIGNSPYLYVSNSNSLSFASSIEYNNTPQASRSFNFEIDVNGNAVITCCNSNSNCTDKKLVFDESTTKIINSNVSSIDSSFRIYGLIGTSHPSQAASCTQEGNVEYYYCSDCQKYFDSNMNQIITPFTKKADHQLEETTIDGINCQKCKNCSYCEYNENDLITATINAINNLDNIYDDGFEEKLDKANNLIEMISEEKRDEVTNKSMLDSINLAFDELDAIDMTSLETKQQAILNTAYAFYDRKTQFQYDQYSYRRNAYSTPESGNDFNYTYLDCSSFVNAIYRTAFDISSIQGYTNDTQINTKKMMEYASDHCNDKTSYPDIVYYENISSTVGSKTDSDAAQVRSLLQSGDFYVYRHKTDSGKSYAGHVMLYVVIDGKDYFFHATGTANASGNDIADPTITRYRTEQATEHETGYGTLCLDSADVVFVSSEGTKGEGGTTNRYIYDSDNTEICIIRPLNRDVSLTKDAYYRLTNKDVRISKESSVANLSSLENNELINNTIEINNKSNVDTNYMYIEASVPENTEFSSSTITPIQNNGKLVWKIENVAANSILSISYTLKVNGSLGGQINDNETYVNGVKTAQYYYTINNNINSKNLSDLDTKLQAYATDTSSFTDILASIKDSYNVAEIELPDAFNSCSSLQEVIRSAFTTDNYRKLTNSALNDLSIPNLLFGGNEPRYYYTNYTLSEPEMYCCRNLKSEMLESGDIMIGYHNYSSTTNKITTTQTICTANVYTGNWIYCMTLRTTVVGTNDPENELTIEKFYSTATFNSRAHTMPFYDAFIVVRPSLISQ